jgi:hypothetical protein
MRRVLSFVALLLVGVLAFPSVAKLDDSPFSTRAIIAYRNALTDLGKFGAPRYTTALLPTCATGNTGGIAFDTTTGTLKVCGGSSWAGMGVNFGGASGGTATRVLFTDGSGNLADDADLTFSTDTLTATKIAATTLTGDATFNSTTAAIFGANTIGVLAQNTTHTPDTLVFYTGTTSNALHIKEFGDAAHDGRNCEAGTSASADPALCIHSRNQTTTEWLQFKNDGNGRIKVGTGSVLIDSPLVWNDVNNVLSTNAQIQLGGSAGAGNEHTMLYSSVQTPDNMVLGLGATGKALHIMERADISSDLNNCGAGTSAQTAPTLCLHSADTVTTEWLEFNVQTDGLARIVANQGFTLQGAVTKTLTDNTIATFVRISCASGDAAAGIVDYVTFAEDGTTESQIEKGTLQFVCLNLAGTESAPTPTKQGTALYHETSAGTADMTSTFAADTATPTNGIDLRVTVDTGIGSPTAVEIRYQVQITSGTATVTPQ